MSTQSNTIAASGAGAGAGGDADFDFSGDTSQPNLPASPSSPHSPTTTSLLTNIAVATAFPIHPSITPHSTPKSTPYGTPHMSGYSHPYIKDKKKKLVIKGSPAFSHSIPDIDLSIPGLDGLDGFNLDGATPKNMVIDLTGTTPSAKKGRRGASATGSGSGSVSVKQNRRKQTENVRASIDDFFVPSIPAFQQFETANFNTNQLKQLCRHHKLNVSGIKITLQNRISTFLRQSCLAIQLQRLYRGFITRKYIHTRGPGIYKRSICVNDTDFLSLDDLTEIPHYQFFSFKDADGHVYGFDVRSAHTMFCSGKHQKKDIFNPYNRKEIPDDIIRALKTNISSAKLMKYPIELEIKEDVDAPPLTPEQKFNQELVTILQAIDQLGNYTNMSWFTGLTHYGWLALINHIFDIWIYRSQLPEETRREFFPPNGKPFTGVRIERVRVMQTKELKECAITILRRFVMTSPNEEMRKLGALYVLGALTLVCPPAAQAMPWLYESLQ